MELRSYELGITSYELGVLNFELFRTNETQ